MKRVFAFIIAALLAFLLVDGLQLSAAEILVQDDADLFTAQEEQQLQQQAEKFEQTYGLPVFIMTTTELPFSNNGARDVIESLGESRFPDGYVAYAVNMSDRSYWVDAYGNQARSIYSQGTLDDLSDDLQDLLADGQYYQSARSFLDGVSKRYEIKGSKWGFLKKPLLYPMATAIMAIGSGVFALVISLIWTGFQVKKHKDKTLQVAADGYGRDLEVLREREQLCGHYQTRVARAESSSGHGGSGASSGHTGSGGHF